MRLQLNDLNFCTSIELGEDLFDLVDINAMDVEWLRSFAFWSTSIELDVAFLQSSTKLLQNSTKFQRFTILENKWTLPIECSLALLIALLGVEFFPIS